MTLPMMKAKYNARACGAATFALAKSGNHQIAIPFEIVEGEHTGENITWIGTFSDNTTERVIESLMHLGWQGEDPGELTNIDDKCAMEMMPETVQLVCEPDTYDGKTKLKVQWVNKLGAGRFAFKEQLGASELKSFGAQLKNTIRSVRAQGGATRASNGGGKPTQPSTPTKDDKIPF